MSGYGSLAHWHFTAGSVDAGQSQRLTGVGYTRIRSRAIPDIVGANQMLPFESVISVFQHDLEIGSHRAPFDFTP
jgi:hypothetical protein